MRWPLLIVSLALFLQITCQGLAQDLRQSFGTKSLDAAQALDRGIKLVQEKHPREALTPLEEAIRHDPQLQLALYWKILALVDLGKVDEAVSSAEEMVAIAEKTTHTNVTIDGCINMALTLGNAGEDQQATRWFTRAIMFDPQDEFGLRWKALRNMSISLYERKRYLSAAVCVMLAYRANAERVGLDMVRAFLEKVEEDAEAAHLLDFGDELPKIAARSAPTKLTPGGLDGISEPVTHLMLEPATGKLVALCRGTTKYYVIDYREGNRVQAMTAPEEIVAGAIAGQALYLSTKSPAAISRHDLATGKEEQTWKLRVDAPYSLAVLAAQRAIYFPHRSFIHRLDMDAGDVAATENFATLVATDPRQRFCYGYVRSERSSTIGHIVIDGRVITLQRAGHDWQQTALFKFAPAGRDLLLADFRVNAASNGQQLMVSPDGQIVAVVGGGGWRPANTAQGGGYGVAAFAAADFGHVQGYFPTEPYPRGADVNPVTGQVAVVREKDLKVYHLGKTTDPVTIEGKFTGPVGWSGDGRYLYAAGATGLSVWENELTAAETELADSWHAGLVAALPAVKSAPPKVEETPPDPLFEKFAASSELADVRAVMRRVQSAEPGSPLTEWLRYPPYQQNAEHSRVFDDAVGQLQSGQAGVAAYRIRKLEREAPDHPGIDYLLGMVHYVNNENDEAKERHLQVIRRDAGRTNLTRESLRCLARVYRRIEDHAAAAYCYLHVLLLDPDNSKWTTEAKLFLDAAGLADEAKGILERPATRSAATGLPALPVAASADKLSAEKLFEQSAPSVVLIKTRSSIGTGVCVAEPGIILTNRHVIAGGEPRVYPYGFEGGKLRRLESQSATVLYRSDEEDLAVLKIGSPPKSLAPLGVVSGSPRPGSKVFALGNPGLGEEVLEQTISEGIVSSPPRSFGGRVLTQHTASVNPGNSGGPLLNESGQVVGIVTLKADLENVSFAIPAETVRRVFGDPADK